MPNTKDPFEVIDDTAANELIVQQITPVNFATSYDPSVTIKEALDSMNIYDQVTINTQRHREELAKKVLTEAMHADLDETDSELLQAKLAIVNAARSVLNDIDKAAKDHVSTKLKKKDTENAAAANINMAAFLAKIQTTAGTMNTSGSIVLQSEQEIEAALEKKFDDDGVIVLDTELEMGDNQIPATKTEE